MNSVITEDLLNFNSTTTVDVVGRKNYKGEDILYFTDGENIPRRINVEDTITNTSFSSSTTLITHPELPRIEDLNILESGELLTGLYSFAVRLVTSGGNVSAFSHVSSGIPIVDEKKVVGEIQYDGAEPQQVGGKSIVIKVSNINLNYAYIEVAVITYIGTDNVLTANSIGTFAITSDTKNVTFYSNNQYTDTILLEELVSTAVNYTQAKNILQKDNHLFLSNLKSSNENIDTEMQTLANNIIMHYKVEEEYTIVDSTGYHAEVIDSNGVVSDWNTSGKYDNHSIRLKANLNTDFKGFKEPKKTFNKKGYQRDEVYSFAIVPIFKGGIYGYAYHIPGDANNYTDSTGLVGSQTTTRLRGWKNSDGTIHHRMPSIIKESVVDNESVLNKYRYLGVIAKNIIFPDTLKKSLEGYVIVRQRRKSSLDGIVIAQGIFKQFYDGPSNSLFPAPHNGKSNMDLYTTALGITTFGRHAHSGVDFAINREYQNFFSPDIIHGVVDESHAASATELIIWTFRKITRRADNRQSDPATISSDGKHKLGVFYQDTGFSNLSNHGELAIRTPILFSYKINPFEQDTAASILLPDNKIIKAKGLNGGIVYKTPHINRDYYNYSVATGHSWIKLDSLTAYRFLISQETETVEITNLYNLHDFVYGDLETAEYIKAEEVFFDSNTSEEVSFFGGDTFISKYCFINRENIDSSYVGRDNIFVSNIETFIETRGNYDYRHTSEFDIPYAPKYPYLLERDPSVSEILGVWNYTADKGMPTGYNKQYNFENTINTYFKKNIQNDPVTNFPDRTIYSIASIENEQIDSYKVFLSNNYHDIPKETGEIINIFEYNNSLYLHTAHSLWKSFVNEKTTSATSSGEIVLGNGGLFPIPSEKIYTQQGGFAGSGIKEASVNTPYGRVFLDNHQRKVFLLKGNSSLQELTEPHMRTYFNNNIIFGDDKSLRLGYDPLTKRVLISVTPTILLSYDMELQSWNSFHSYFPNSYSYLDNKLYCSDYLGNLHEMSTGVPGVFFGGLYSSSLEYIVNEGISTTKEFRNIKWIQEHKDIIFNNMHINTDQYNTGFFIPKLITTFADEQSFLPLGEQHVHKIGDEFRMTIPPDNSAGYTDELFRPSIKGKFLKVGLTHLAVDGNPLVLQHIDTEYIKVAE